METLRNEPVILTGNSPIGSGGGYGSSGDLLSTILAASLIGGGIGGFNRGYAPATVDMGTLLTEKSNGDTRRDVKESESEIRESIHQNSHNTSSEFRGLEGRLASIDKEALASRYESQIASKDATVYLDGRIDTQTSQLRDQVNCFSNGVDRQFVDLRYEIQRGLQDIKDREMAREIADLRRDKEAAERQNQSQSIVNALLSVLRPGTVPTP